MLKCGCVLQRTFNDLVSFSVRVGILVPPRVNRNWSATLTFFRNRDLDLAGLKLILAHEMMDFALTVRSSMNALMGWLLNTRSRHGTSFSFCLC